MRKAGRIAVLCAFSILFLCASSRAASVDLGRGEPLAVRAIASDGFGVTLSVEIGSLRFTPIKNRDGDKFWRISLPGSDLVPVVGDPEIPVVTRLIQIPAEGGASLSVTSVEYKTVNLYDLGNAWPLWPVQPPVVKLPGARENAPFVINAAAYVAGGFQGPATRLGEVGVMRGMRFVPITIAPVRYDASANALKIATRMTVRIRFQVPALRAGVLSDPAYNYSVFGALAGGLFLNHASLAAASDGPAVPAPPVPGGYLIVASPGFADNADLLDLASWKAEKGFDVHVVSTDETGATADDIKAYVHDAYASWDIPPAYLLLVGDTDTVPCFAGTQDDNPDTDLYFAAQDGEDYFPDLFYARLPVRTDEQLAHIVAKILHYELAGWADAADYVTATFMASTDRSDVSEGTHNYCIDTWLSPAGFMSHKRYSAQGATTDEVIADIDAGLNYLIYSGHGSTDSWSDGPPFEQSRISDLTNTNYPFVASHACDTGMYGLDECFGEAWVRDANGAMAFYGSSVTSYWDEDDILQRRYFDGMFDAGLPRRYHTIGEFTAYGMAKLWEFYAGGGSSQRYYEMYNVFGDASVDLFTARPTAMDVSHSPVIFFGSTSFTVAVSGEEGALVGLSLDGGFIASALTDAGGAANLTWADPIANPGGYTVTVTKHDRVPYQAGVLAAPASSDGLLAASPDVVGDGMTIHVMIADADLAGDGTTGVDVSSDAETTPETLALDEAGAGTGVFIGTITARAFGSPAPDDGFINVEEGDTVTVHYHDADDGSGPEEKYDEVAVDLTPPVFAGIDSIDSADKTLTLHWNAAAEPHGPVTYQIYRADASGAQDFDSPLAQTTALSHVDGNLVNGQSYFYVVRATDKFGNRDGNTAELEGVPVGPMRIFFEDFETRSVGDWTVEDGGGDGLTWSTADECGSGASSVTHGTYMLADSDCPGWGTVMSEGLVSPSIDCSGFTGVFLRFGDYAVNWWSDQSCKVQVSVGGGEWITLMDFPGEKEETTRIDLAAYADHAGDVRLRFFYTGDFAYWWAVDDIELLGYGDAADDDSADDATDDATDDSSDDASDDAADDAADDALDDDSSDDALPRPDDDVSAGGNNPAENSGGACGC